jgi:glycosyltransferase involved in cell wall biosynthesis
VEKERSISVIVPFYNAERTLGKCLSSIFGSDSEVLEVIAVDDRSTDSSLDIVRTFSCKVLRSCKKGESFARNTGIDQAQGELIVFIDADIILEKDTLTKIRRHFAGESEVDAVTGLLSKKHFNKDFFSIYKNLYMNYIFMNMPDRVTFLYGSIFVVTKEAIESFDTSRILLTPDTELGIRLNKKGKKIILDKDIKVIHQKKYSLFSFIKNEFIVPFSWSYVFLKHIGYRDFFVQKGFAHARHGQILGVLLSPLFFISLFIGMKDLSFFSISLFLAAIIAILHIRFVLFVNAEKNILFAGRCLITAFFDDLIMFCGIAAGFFAYSFKRILADLSK